MSIARLRRIIAGHLAWACIASVLLLACQPFLAVHFRHDGWEDEPALRIRSVGELAQFEPDLRGGHHNELEVTLFAPTAASIDLPDALARGLDRLLALVLLGLSLTIVLLPFAVPVERPLPQRVPASSRAPPSARAWLRLPPQTAPPLTTH